MVLLRKTDDGVFRTIKTKIGKNLQSLKQLISKKKIIPIVLATNQKYAPYALVAIQSVIDNSNPRYYYDIYILYTELDDDTIKKLTLNNDNYRVSTINLNQHAADLVGIKIYAHFSIETMLRFYIPDYIDYEKVVYLDCDMIVLGDISGLYKIKLENKTVAAVWNYMSAKTSDYVETVLNLKPDQYFNAGLLIIDTKKMKEKQIKENAIQLLKEHPEYWMLDQDALNIILSGDVKYLPLEWNVQISHFANGNDIVTNADECYNAFLKPKIIHYTGSSKPWDYPVNYSNQFWNYAKRTVFYEDIYNNYTNSVVANNEMKN